MRAVGLDVHRDFCEVAIVDGGPAAVGGPDQDRPEELELFAQSLDPRDRVALEVTGNAWAIAADPRAARRAGDRRLAERHRHPPGAREDRPPRRAGRWPSCCGPASSTACGRPDERIRTMRRRLARRAQLVRGALPGQERDPRGADALPEGPPARVGPVRRQGPALAGRAAAAGLRARDRRRRAAPGRLPRRGDRRGRAADRRRRAVLAGDQAADDRPRRQRDRRRDLHGRRRRHPPLPTIGASWPATSASIRGSASPATRRPTTATSPSRARAARATRSSRRAGRPSASPARSPRSTSASKRGAGTRSRSSPPRASSPACSGVCSPAARTTPTPSRR